MKIIRPQISPIGTDIIFKNTRFNHLSVTITNDVLSSCNENNNRILSVQSVDNQWLKKVPDVGGTRPAI
jgi:hypothetical protein